MSEYEYAESGVLLTFRELTLLLQSVGVRYINGFCLSESEISDEEVIQLIGSLVRKGILKTSDTEFYMEDMVEKMICCIGWPDEDYEIEQDVYKRQVHVSCSNGEIIRKIWILT